jgi:general secretion pathway protein E/type IV pilus assembly protein PilB
VFSTLHSNSALGALPRLLDIGIQPGLLAGNLTAIVAQRLLRRLCPDCRRLEPARPEEHALLGLQPDQPAPGVHRAQGCPACHGRGYRGRLAAMEILVLDDELEGLIGSTSELPRLRAALESRGHRDLATAAASHVLHGDTSPEEVLRVIGRRRPAGQPGSTWA